MRTFNQLIYVSRRMLLAPVLILMLSFFIVEKNYGQLQDIIPFVDCVEVEEIPGIGSVTLAYFGYYNPNPFDIDLTLDPPGNSEIIYFSNPPNSPGTFFFPAPVFTFAPGRHYGVFPISIDGPNDTVYWEITMPDFLSSNFTIATAADLGFCSNTVPYLEPPLDGKDNSIIGAELTSLFNVFTPADPNIESNLVFRIDGDKVLVKVGCDSNGPALLDQFGMTDRVIRAVSGNFVVSGFIPIENLNSLNDHPNVFDFAQPVFPPILNGGIVTTLGDIAQGSFAGREGFGLSGEGVKVGVISDSYNTLLPPDQAEKDVLNGDLPGIGNPDGNLLPVQVLKDLPIGSGTDEGRALLQIVHDVAPGAELFFHTGFTWDRNDLTGNSLEMERAIEELQAAGCDVIVDDISFIDEPFFEDGTVAKAVDAAVEAGVTYVTSAGNFGTDSYESDFNGEGLTGSIPGFAHIFGQDQNGANITSQCMTLPPGDYTIVLQWEDDWYSLTGNGITAIHSARRLGWGMHINFVV